MACTLHNSVAQSLVGLAAADAYAKILLSHHDVQQVSVYKYNSPPPLSVETAY